jgi:chromosome segregation ATPase
MSEIAEIIDTLENRIEKLFIKIKSLEDKNLFLQEELNKTAMALQDQSKAFEAVKSDYETLKVANSLLGSDDYKRDTKLKINALIREIDYCIAQLSD